MKVVNYTMYSLEEGYCLDRDHLAHWLSKRSRPLTKNQWCHLLDALEKKDMYLVISPMSKSYAVSSYNAELVPLSSCDDQMTVMDAEEIRLLGYNPCHMILNPKQIDK